VWIFITFYIHIHSGFMASNPSNW